MQDFTIFVNSDNMSENNQAKPPVTTDQSKEETKATQPAADGTNPKPKREKKDYYLKLYD